MAVANVNKCCLPGMCILCEPRMLQMEVSSGARDALFTDFIDDEDITGYIHLINHHFSWL